MSSYGDLKTNLSLSAVTDNVTYIMKLPSCDFCNN